MLDAKFNKLAISSAIENHGDITPYENETQQRQYFKNFTKNEHFLTSDTHIRS